MGGNRRIVLLIALVLLSCSHQTRGHGGRKMLQDSSKMLASLQDLLNAKLEGLQPGMTGDDVLMLKKQMASLGYYLVEGGLSLGNNSESILNSYFDPDLRTAVTRYQQFNNISLTGGKIDKVTAETLLGSRCGFPDIVNKNFWNGTDPDLNLRTYKVNGAVLAPGPSAGRRLLFTRTAGGVQFTKTNLTYAFDTVNTTTDLGQEQLRTAFLNALQSWQDVSNLTFTEELDITKADIKFRFAVGAHGDGSPFAEGTLAHAFSPTSGELHVNDVYMWEDDASKGVPNGFDLESVVLHELGHVLGLGHSDNKDAVMFPSLPNNVNKRTLHSDDTDGIQSIYGGSSRAPKAPAPPTVTVTGGTNNLNCNCSVGFTGWANYKLGSLSCRRYCYCDTGSGSSYTCYSGLRLAADAWCYPPYFFPKYCQDDATAASSGEPLVSDTLIVDPQTTTITSRRQAARDADPQVIYPPPTSGSGTNFGAPDSTSSSLPSAPQKLQSSMAVFSALSMTIILLGFATI